MALQAGAGRGFDVAPEMAVAKEGAAVFDVVARGPTRRLVTKDERGQCAVARDSGAALRGCEGGAGGRRRRHGAGGRRGCEPTTGGNGVEDSF